MMVLSIKEVLTLAAGFIIENGVLVRYDGVDTEVTVPEGAAKIAYQAFQENRTLVQVAWTEKRVRRNRPLSSDPILDPACMLCRAFSSVYFLTLL